MNKRDKPIRSKGHIRFNPSFVMGAMNQSDFMDKIQYMRTYIKETYFIYLLYKCRLNKTLDPKIMYCFSGPSPKAFRRLCWLQ